MRLFLTFSRSKREECFLLLANSQSFIQKFLRRNNTKWNKVLMSCTIACLVYWCDRSWREWHTSWSYRPAPYCHNTDISSSLRRTTVKIINAKINVKQLIKTPRIYALPRNLFPQSRYQEKITSIKTQVNLSQFYPEGKVELNEFICFKFAVSRWSRY